ncbi:T9SS type A sorting domain-containing protein [Stygiobacter electus]|uniref:T9SS type A sorting domain-containing protein n=1 Tax=Stygiobacter electus TaxID=3032292 RepID=A0AAE3NYG6_9BACT|nr:T9SS type A sorting domain-containing protein [Stygiobacter electus]MDF1610909.1 T9SS type A sorting domain-containing protein [Stygiobacter electus]
MNKKLIRFLSVMLLLVGATGFVLAKGGDGKKNTLNKTLGEPVYTKFNINNISTWIKNNGETDINQNGNSGLVFPKGSNKTAVFQSGFLWGGKVDGQIRVGGSVYRQGTVPGYIKPDFTAASPDDPDVRIYRVRRDYKTGDLSSELADGDGPSIDAIRTQYEKDWNEWPWKQGAPFEDVNGNKTYEPNVDIPGVPGADQTIWFVANDLDPAKTDFMYGSLPMGIEEQVTVWGYNTTGALGNMLFRKFIIINKNKDKKAFTDMYVSMWSDPDLGDAGDDFVGCDTTLSLGYVYNANASDRTYDPLPPPSAGFDFFQGPIVAGAAEDVAIFKGKKVSGKKNLPMTAFYFFINGDPVYTDPTQGNYDRGTLGFYNLFQGKVSTTGQYFTDPTTNKPTTKALAGDPLTRTGWVDGLLHPPGDRRLGMASGPFNMAFGDTQEVVVAEICAGAIPGVDRLGAIGLLKFYDLQAQLAYDNFFNVPTAPPAPVVTASEMDAEIILTWGSDAAKVAATENYEKGGYKFQGYNVYQLPSATAQKSEARLIATYDVVDGVGKITDLEFDPVGGVVQSKVVQFGTDSGVKRSISIKNDVFNGGLPVYNGSKYFFAVTAYAYNADPLAVPKVLENPLNVITTVPQKPKPGVRYESSYGTEIIATHKSGISDGNVTVSVVDPTKVTGHKYQVSFEADGWILKDLTTSKILLTKQTNQNADELSPMVDGMLIKVAGAPNDFKDFLVTANANGSLNPPEYGAFAFNNSGFPHPSTGDRPTKRQQVRGGLWGIHTGNIDDQSYDFDFFKTRVTQGGARWPRIIPNDFEIRFKPGKAFLYPGSDYGGHGKLVDVPFQIWNIGTKPDASDDIRYFPYILDVNENGVFDLSGVDHPISGGDNDPETDWFYWIIPKDMTPGESGYNAIVNKIQTVGDDNHKYLDSEIMSGDALRRMVLVNWNGGSVSDSNWPKNVNSPMPEEGTVFKIISTKPNQPGSDVFEFTTPSVTVSDDLAKQDVEQINVFPNPYYGVNPQELNKYQRFVTFTHLPTKATIRIFNLAGQLVRTLEKDTPDQFFRWDLNNKDLLPVASGLYIVHIDMPDLGKTKILKVAVIQEQQVLDRF